MRNLQRGKKKKKKKKKKLNKKTAPLKKLWRKGCLAVLLLPLFSVLSSCTEIFKKKKIIKGCWLR